MYDIPCYDLTKICITETGEISISSSEDSCKVILYFKDASIKVEEYKVRLRQSNPKTNISFNTGNANVVSKAFEDFKNF